MEIRYIHNERVHNKKSASIVLPLLFNLYRPDSIIDVGCGLATWIAAAQDLGVSDVIGVDGDYVDRSMLAVDETKFIPKDLTQPFSLNRKFDLVISLEVAEHLPESAAHDFVRTLVSHGDVIMFSASIPLQGKGQNHINEQWLSYWVELFRPHGFAMHDVIRPLIWNNNEIEYYYKQNIVIFCREGHELSPFFASKSSPYTDLVHPECFSLKFNDMQRATLYEEGKLGVSVSFKSFIKALFVKIKKIFVSP